MAFFGGIKAVGQDNGFIYGIVTTIDDNTYEGAMRWGKEEIFWTDFFNASKEENDNLDYLSRDEREELEDRRGSSWTNSKSWGWGDDKSDFLHQFVCQFGEIKSIKPTSRQGVKLTIQSGLVFDLDGQGYNDINTEVRVYSDELGTIKLDWDRIALIEFMDTPRKLKAKWGEPLYGEVETSEGTFKGFVQWDHDERISTDKLDGDSEDGDMSIEFGNIKSIKKYGSSRSLVVLNSGRKLELRGSNDVNDENRGIIVTVEGLGRVDVPWDEFEMVTFTEAPGSGPSYKSFATQDKLSGKVIFGNDDSAEGLLTYDLDESYQFEVLQGMLDDVELLIPFRNIAEIQPRNYNNSTVVLKNGEKYVLSESQDVTDKNQGVLVGDGNNYRYFPFGNVERIEFK